MIVQSGLRLWGMRAGYLGFGLVVILVHLMPGALMPARLPAPDFIMALTFAWATRRPEYVPSIAIATVVLLADFLFQRPPGLWAVLVVAGAALLKTRGRFLRDLPFWVEWLNVAIIMLGLHLGYRLASSLLMIAQAPLSLTIVQLSGTIVIYPLVVVLSYAATGLRKSTPGELDPTGHRP